MNRCHFNYINGSCDQQPMAISHKDQVIKVTSNPIGKNDDYFVAYSEVSEYDNLCQYHKKIMSGRMLPYSDDLIEPLTLEIIKKNRISWERNFWMKKGGR